VDDIRVFSQANASTWTQAFIAEPGATIEVPLPEDYPDLPINAKICQTSSQAVKQRYEWPAPRPSLCRARYPVYFDLTIAAQRLTVLSQPCAGPRELSDREDCHGTGRAARPCQQAGKCPRRRQNLLCQTGATLP